MVILYNKQYIYTYMYIIIIYIIYYVHYNEIRELNKNQTKSITIYNK